MDKFLKQCGQKTIIDYPREHRTLAIVGKPGIGKTWTLQHMFGPSLFITLDYEILKGKQSTLDFLTRVSGTHLPVLLDEFETVSELVGLREINGPPSLGMFVIASQVPVVLDFDVHTWLIPWRSVSEIAEIGKGRAPTNTLKRLAEECNGDVRRFLQALEFTTDFHDTFQTPRQFIYSLLSNDSPEVNPVTFIGDHVHEHGYLYGVVQENYVDAQGITLDEIADIAESLSRASVVDDLIYDGAWELMPYFTVDACIWPAFKLEHRLDTTKMRPGSMWTKFQNGRMRTKKVRALSRRTTTHTLDVHALLVLRDYCVADSPEAIQLLNDYELENQDLDVMNHIALDRKIKAKALATLKKCVAKTPKLSPRPSLL
jgi:hypothetical protein